jgi:hypothetical protein
MATEKMPSEMPFSLSRLVPAISLYRLGLLWD